MSNRFCGVSATGSSCEASTDAHVMKSGGGGKSQMSIVVGNGGSVGSGGNAAACSSSWLKRLLMSKPWSLSRGFRVSSIT